MYYILCSYCQTNQPMGMVKLSANQYQGDLASVQGLLRMVAFNIPTAQVAMQQCRTDLIHTWLGEGAAGRVALGAMLFKGSTRTATTTKQTRKKEFVPVDAAHSEPHLCIHFFFHFFSGLAGKAETDFRKDQQTLHQPSSRQVSRSLQRHVQQGQAVLQVY